MKKNENGEFIVEHHTHYLEIHGYDKTVWMTASAHRLLHINLRKTGKCDIPVDVLIPISQSAQQRTKKTIEYNKARCKKYRKNRMHLEIPDSLIIRMNLYNQRHIDQPISFVGVTILALENKMNEVERAETQI